MADISSIAGRQINTYDNLSQTSQAKMAAHIETVSITDSADTSSASNNDLFVQSVLQTLQSLGLNPDEIPNEVLQIFTQNLYNALIQSGNNVPATDNGVDNTPVPVPENTDGIETKFSGGTNFQYSIDLSGADLGGNLSDVKANITTALENIGQFISSKAVFNLKILTENVDTNMLAQANASVIATTDNPDNVNADTTFIADSIRGVDFNSSTHDSTLYINLAKMDQMSFTGVATPDKYDLTSILTHEILHGLAFTGLIDRNTTIKTAYDGLISIKNDVPFFVGRHAKTANGGNPVPLSPVDAGSGSAYYHVAIPEDLMSASIRKGEVKSISNLDVAMLEDMGISITGTSAPDTNSDKNAKLQMAYSNSNNLLNNLTDSLTDNSALQADFSNLIQSKNDLSSTVNLQDFLQQFAFDNGNSIQNSTGSLFSATA